MASFPAGKSFEKMKEEWDKTPLFMTTIPTEEELESNDTLAAIQSLIYDDNPIEVAINFKNQGNEWFQMKPKAIKNLKEALTYYSKGLAVNYEDLELNATLLLNRAACNLELENYGRVLKDCSIVLNNFPKNVKALYRSGKACLKLEKFEEADNCVLIGLHIDPQNIPLIKLKSEIQTLSQIQIQKANTIKEKQLQIKNRETLLISTISSRKTIKLVNADGKQVFVPQTFVHPLGGESRVHFDNSKNLVWPVMFLYPEFQESDFIASFNETSTFNDHLETIFEHPAPFDLDHAYKPENISILFVKENKTLARVGKDMSLKKFLDTPESGFIVSDGVCSFYCLVKGSEFEKSFKKGFKK